MAKQKQPETMEELTNSIRHACELTQNLESHLPNLANDPATLFLSIDEIVNTLSAAKEKLLVFQQGQTPASSFAQMIPLEMKQHQMDATPMQDYAQKIDQLPQMQQLQAAAPYGVGAHFLQSKMMGSVDFTQLRSRGTLQIGNMDGRDVEERSKGSEGEVQAIEAPPPRPRRSKKVDLEKITKMVPAPEFGNTELPPDHDGFSWRKYGNKEILGSKYPRSYYRCTHQKLYECLAKKQVQRVDSNPRMFQVTYRGNHTCHMSSTAPSSSVPLPPPPQQLLVDMSQDMTIQSSVSTQLSPSSASASGSRWLPTMNLSLQVGGGGMAPAAADACSGSAGASTSSRYGGDYAVVDMADVMFNSGSSSGNSMESLFPPPSDE